MIKQLLAKILNITTDDAVKNLLTQDYPLNPFGLVTSAERLSVRALVETGMRANTGTKLQRSFGSPIVLSPWEKILLNPKQLFSLPTATALEVDTAATVGVHANRPLNLDIPIMITGMSYGGSLSLPLKMALAEGSAIAGTSTNTGESSITPEERQRAKYIVGQYNRYGVMNTPQELEQVDAIEVQFGQGAWGGAVESVIKSATIDERLQTTLGLKPGQDSVRTSRMPGIKSTGDIAKLVNSLKMDYDVPVGVKIAGSDYIEYELDVVASTDADFIVIDGAEGGTAVAPPTLEDNLGLPTLHSLVRAVDWLEEQGVRNRFTVIGAGGLSTPGHFLKAMAVGADLVYIGSAAVIAAIISQVADTLPMVLPTQLALYQGKQKDHLDVAKAAASLGNFLASCKEEMILACQAMGKSSLRELCRDDLVTVDKELAEFMGIRYAASRRKERVPALI